MIPETWEHMEMMINEGQAPASREQIIEWLESQPITPPPRFTETESTRARRRIFEVLEPHYEDSPEDEFSTCNWCFEAKRMGRLINLDEKEQS